VFPFYSEIKFGKTRIIGLPGSEDSLTIGWAVSTQYQRQRVTDGRTDRQTDVQPISRTCAVWLTHVKNYLVWYKTCYLVRTKFCPEAIQPDSDKSAHPYYFHTPQYFLHKELTVKQSINQSELPLIIIIIIIIKDFYSAIMPWLQRRWRTHTVMNRQMRTDKF